MHTITYEGNDKETYNLVYNGEVVAELLVGEDGAMEIADKIWKFMSVHVPNNCEFYIQNDSDFPPLGVIVDVYQDDDCIDSLHFMFDDFIDE